MKHLLVDSQQASCPGICESSLNGEGQVAACQSTQGKGISCMCGESGGGQSAGAGQAEGREDASFQGRSTSQQSTWSSQQTDMNEGTRLNMLHTMKKV